MRHGKSPASALSWGATNCPFNRILTLARAKSRIRYSVPTPHNRPVTDERATF
jgi:hypothetical protein